jgi:bifunctional non-homologous end joining protein LigD
LVYYAFDILHLEVFDLRGCALLDRKCVLEALLAEGPGIFRNACGMKQGIVSKRVDGTYQSGRTHLWRKSTCKQRDTFHVVGWAQKAGRFDRLHLGRKECSKIIYAGKLERGFTEADRKRILEQHEKLKIKKQLIVAPRKFPKATWSSPR